MALGRWCPGGKVHVMMWRKCLALLALVLVLALAVPVQASQTRGSFSPIDAFWQLVQRLVPWSGLQPVSPPEKDEEDRGSGIDPSGLVFAPGSGGESSPAIDPNGLEVPDSGPASDPNGAS